MNRKAKNIIYWTIAGILIFVFVVCFIFGCIKTMCGAGTQVYIHAGKIITGLGLSKSDFYNWSPYVCMASGAVLAFMFYKKYNTRIN